MKLSLTVDDLADALLRRHGQNVEYPYLTPSRIRRIAVHELSVEDMDAAIEPTPDAAFDWLGHSERERRRASRSASALHGAAG
jgi:hypothetical protein